MAMVKQKQTIFQAWNKSRKEYLGTTTKTQIEGVRMHYWTFMLDLLGCFHLQFSECAAAPTFCYNAMEQNTDTDSLLEMVNQDEIKGDRDRIHIYELESSAGIQRIRATTEEELEPKYYIEYQKKNCSKYVILIKLLGEFGMKPKC